jgi:hypothetical protein
VFQQDLTTDRTSETGRTESFVKPIGRTFGSKALWLSFVRIDAASYSIKQPLGVPDFSENCMHAFEIVGLYKIDIHYVPYMDFVWDLIQ